VDDEGLPNSGFCSHVFEPPLEILGISMGRKAVQASDLCVQWKLAVEDF